MKKTFTKTFTIGFLALAFVLSACGGYTPDRSYMSQEQKDQEQQKLNEAVERYETAANDTEKNENAASIAFRNMNLGNYSEAIKYYEQVIKSDPTHYPALTNLTVMYEEMGEISKAIEYEGMLYDYYTDNAEVNSDFVRLLIENNQFEEAGRVVEAFKLTEKAIGNEEFIKDLEETIEKGKEKVRK